MVQRQDGETLGRKIAVISALGGQGCSLAAAGMGLAAAELGKSVTLLDWRHTGTYSVGGGTDRDAHGRRIERRL